VTDFRFIADQRHAQRFLTPYCSEADHS
jgi:hypothetical protein